MSELSAPDRARLQAALAIGVLSSLPALAGSLLPSVQEPPSPSCGVLPMADPEAGPDRWRCLGPSAPPVESLWLGRRIDLNQADASALTVVPGIGPRLAARIIEDRAERGRFERLEQLERVKGVGPKLRARAEAYLEVRPLSGPPSARRAPRESAKEAKERPGRRPVGSETASPPPG